jgi:protoporphyrinogen oxidase
MSSLIIGSGFTGLGAGLSSGLQIIEAKDRPGGICASYQIDGFRFEIGGGHWIFGRDGYLLDLINHFARCREYRRRSAVFFAGNLESTRDLKYKFINYPIQNNLYALGERLASRAVDEIIHNSKRGFEGVTMSDWLIHYFGETLYQIFFAPFHDRYTAGLYKNIAPQDPYKSPVNIKSIIDGASGNPDLSAGYNATFVYPEEGLDILSERIACLCNVEYGKAVVKINPELKSIKLSDGKEIEFERLISTIPLNRLMELCGFQDKPEPYTSVLVINMGVELKENEIARHGNHWLYIPDSLTGFHRVGYYSNVDPLFLPDRFRNHERYGSLYIEFAFMPDKRPSRNQIEDLIKKTEAELQEWGFIKRVLVSDSTWIDVAYTWQRPESRWVLNSIERLKNHGIISAGRYGRWNFQGILESLKEGIFEGLKAKAVTCKKRL